VTFVLHSDYYSGVKFACLQVILFSATPSHRGRKDIRQSDDAMGAVEPDIGY
jgi:hypothetical protein